MLYNLLVFCKYGSTTSFTYDRKKALKIKLIKKYRDKVHFLKYVQDKLNINTYYLISSPIVGTIDQKP